MIIRVLLDFDILLDVLLEREPFVENSSELLQLIESKKIEGYVTPTTLSKIFDVSREKMGDEIAWQAVSDIRAIMKICPIDYRILEKASLFKLGDFETALQMACAILMKLDHVITRKFEYSKWFFTQDFPDISEDSLSVLPPDQFLEGLSNKFLVQKLLRYFEEGTKRLDIVICIVNNASTIINSTEAIFTKQPQIIEAESKTHTEFGMFTCHQYLEQILRYVTYAILVGNFSFLEQHCLNDLRETYQLLNLSYDIVIVALQNMKEATIKIVNDSTSTTTEDFSSVISQLTTYFDYITAAIA